MNEPWVPAPAFWKGKRVLVTGHTGFKGSWLSLWLQRLGAEVNGLSLVPATSPNLFTLARINELCQHHVCDIRDCRAISELMAVIQPQVVFHLAAQALVRAGYQDPVATYATNVMGAVHVLDALRAVQGIKVAVMVTTDKVYSNREWPWPYRESDRLGGHDPYSASKAACELAIASYRDSFLRMQGVAIASARAGNVVGGGDWSEDRLIPDAIRAWQAGRVLEVRRPQAIRPWQHVLEPLCGYLNLAQTLWNRPELAGSYNFGPEAQGAVTVRHLLQLANTCYGQGDVHYAVEEAGVHEARQLSLDISQARGVLRFAPKWPLARTIAQTMAWYVAQQAGGDARSLCDADICAYMEPP